MDERFSMSVDELLDRRETMTQIKTPEQVATDTEEMVEQITKRLFEQVSHGVVKGRGNTDLARITWWGLFDQIEAAVRAGIEADRAQRKGANSARAASET